MPTTWWKNNPSDLYNSIIKLPAQFVFKNCAGSCLFARIMRFAMQAYCGDTLLQRFR